MNPPATTELFRDTPVRIVSHNGTAMIPVIDIANALKYDRGNMTRCLKRNEKLFSPHKGIVKVTTPGGEQELVCLSAMGLNGLLFKMDYVRIKDKSLSDKVLEFQTWAIDTISRREKNELIDTYAAPRIRTATDVINEQLDIADIAIQRSGLPKEIAHGMAWALAANITETELNGYGAYIKAQGKQLQLPEGSHTDRAEYESHFSLTQIAGYLKKSNDTVRNKLEDLKVIYFENGSWKLTRLGEQYGKVFMVTPGFPYSSRQRAYIKYNPAALDLLRKHFGDATPQQSLTEERGVNP